MYDYTSKNLLEYPASYMYSPYCGPLFLDAYFNDRNSFFQACDLEPLYERSINISKLLKKFDQVDPVIINLTEFDIANPIETSRLLSALLLSTECSVNGIVLYWVERLLQRFEVSKKLYDVYEPGFKIGRGCNTRYDHYFKLALLLTAVYKFTEDIRYLNTLLKLNDLLLSVEARDLFACIPKDLFAILVAKEVGFVKKLIENCEL
jgi:hypothetical protein